MGNGEEEARPVAVARVLAGEPPAKVGVDLSRTDQCNRVRQGSAKLDEVHRALQRRLRQALFPHEDIPGPHAPEEASAILRALPQVPSPRLRPKGFAPPTSLARRGLVEFVRLIRSNKELTIPGSKVPMPPERVHRYVTAVLHVRTQRLVVECEGPSVALRASLRTEMVTRTGTMRC